IILAGGKSKRFGSDKALSIYQGKPLIQAVFQVAENLTNNIIIVTNSPEKMGFINYPKYKDLIQGTGSLGGIYTGLHYSNQNLNIVLPCDMPFISPECIRFLLENTNGNDITVPYHRNMLEPLCAVYSKKCLPFIKDQIDTGDYQIFQFYDKVKTKQLKFSIELPFYHENLFSNINTKSDLENISNHSGNNEFH
ncbi:molybdenum cofactor guanylyltransferase, partial [candidate division KSB1 bacterium]|nr:molybdenum cofactor guanylyltransferase [candidate division KSB1 bacterium]